MTENVALMGQAREALRGRWGVAIGGFLIYLVINVVVQRIPFLKWIIPLIIGGPFALGIAGFSLALARGQEVRVEQIFDGFNRFEVACEAYLRILFYVILWMLLLIIPGIIKALEYSQTFYILSDDKTILPVQAMQKSKEMMEGHKEKLFYLGLRYFGLALLCVLTLFIGYLWLMPYMHVGLAKFYEDLKPRPVMENIAPGI